MSSVGGADLLTLLDDAAVYMLFEVVDVIVCSLCVHLSTLDTL